MTPAPAMNPVPMLRLRLVTAALALVTSALAACGGDAGGVSGALSVAEAMAGDTAGYARADRPREFAFPADHGPHPAFKTEWWYVTASLEATDGSARRFGVQFTVFRSALAPDTLAARPSAWAAGQLYMAHVALTDVDGGRFFVGERFGRGAAGLAGATAEPLRVWLGPVELARGAGPDVGGAVPLRLTAATDDGGAYRLDLRPLKPVVLQGAAGLSQKGDEPGNASYYYSQTRMAATGTVTVGGETVPVGGLAWLDREWSTSALGPDQVGWDWFALHLDDGRDLMIYQLRRADGSMHPLSKGTLVGPDGAARALGAAAYTLTPEGAWRSPLGGTYPARWRLRIPAEGLDLTVTPLLAAQELDVSVRYWEGAVAVAGSATGRGYLEMTGYADAASPAPGE